MDILLLMILASMVLALLLGSGFLWAARTGQFEDLDGQAWRILSEEDLKDIKPLGPVVPKAQDLNKSNNEDV